MVYFSGSVYNTLIESLSNVDLTKEQMEQIKSIICNVTKMNPNRAPSTKYECDDPVERHRMHSQKYFERNKEQVREKNRLRNAAKRAESRLEQQQITDINFNGVITA